MLHDTVPFPLTEEGAQGNGEDTKERKSRGPPRDQSTPEPRMNLKMNPRPSEKPWLQVTLSGSWALPRDNR